MRYYDGDFETIQSDLHHDLLNEGDEVNSGHWQSLKNVPHVHTRELFRVCIETPIPQTRGGAKEAIQPNLPWAEDHFLERVSGIPSNPGKEFMNWPWYDPNWVAQGETREFSHTYQERMWPQKAGFIMQIGPGPVRGRRGLRYRLGDLQDVVNLLAKEPTTRQAYLPIWFPEDTGAHHGERVPCSLGYHFILRGGLLHVTYHIRSCDFLRYFRDDVYMAMRLGQWLLEALQAQAPDRKDNDDLSIWDDVQMGLLQMNIVSLHVFNGDMAKMRRTAPPTP